MSNNFQRSPEQFRSVKGGNLPVSWESTKLCMTTGLMLVDFYSQELSHVNSESVCLRLCECLWVRVCACMCVAGFVYACKRMKVWDAGGREKWERLEWEGACSLPRVRWMWLSCLCLSVMPSSPPSVTEAITRGFWTREHAQEMTAFVTHLCQLTARWCRCESPGEQLGFLMSVPVEKSHWHQADLRDKHNYSALPCSCFMCDTGDY